MHDVLREVRPVANEKPGTVLIGETYVSNITDLERYYGKNNELHLPMNTRFGLMDKLDAKTLRANLGDLFALGNRTPLIFVNNHDVIRALSSYPHDPAQRDALAKLLAAVLLTPRATAIAYYGEELGMDNTDSKRLEDVLDPPAWATWPADKRRDGERTPMQWSEGSNGGFTECNSSVATSRS